MWGGGGGGGGGGVGGGGGNIVTEFTPAHEVVPGGGDKGMATAFQQVCVGG